MRHLAVPRGYLTTTEGGTVKKLKACVLDSFEVTNASGDLITVNIGKDIHVHITTEKILVFDGPTVAAQLMIKETTANERLLVFEAATQRYNARKDAEKMSVEPALNLFNTWFDNILRSWKAWFNAFRGN